MIEKDFEIKINVPMIKELVSDKIYRSDASAFREQYVNALSHGCVAYHELNGYTDDVYVRVVFDYGKRMVTITDNGMGMSKTIFSDNFMSFGFSTVDKETNNARSGMFGLGAISFFRIASACIVESWDRRTEERFTFMTRNTDESEFVTNRTLEDHGTKTEIYLKEHVRINTLEQMVRTIASNYPVRTIVEVVNSEQEQNITTYNTTDTDSYDEFKPVMRFKDHVTELTGGKFVTLIDNDEMELYLSTIGRNKNHTYLCRIPIDIQYDTGFTTYLNIKKEKIKGTDSKGRDKLQEVPKPDRDEVNEIAEGYFSDIIEKKCDEMIYDIDIKTFTEYEASDERWILNGYSVDDKLNSSTHKFVQKMREPIRYRNSQGIVKRHETMLTLFGQYKHIMYHASLHKGTYEAIDGHLRKQNFIQWKKDNTDVTVGEGDIENVPWNWQLCIIDNTNGMPIPDAKAFKKEHKIKSVISGGTSGGSPSGMLVRDGSWNNYRIGQADTIESIADKYPGGLYYADGVVGQNELHNVDAYDSSGFLTGVRRRCKVGVIITKKAAKIYPSLKEFYAEIYQAGIDGKVWHMKSKKQIARTGELGQYTKVAFQNEGTDVAGVSPETKLKENRDDYQKMLCVKNFFASKYGVAILPIQCMHNIPMLKDIGAEIIFVPSKLLFGIELIVPEAYSHQSKTIESITQLKYIPQWTTWSKDASSYVWNKYQKVFARYGSPHFACRGEIMQYIVDIREDTIPKPTENEYYEKFAHILQKYNESSYRYEMAYKVMFPELHLESRAKAAGYQNTVRVSEDGGTSIYGYSDEVSGKVPMMIDGKYAAVVKCKETDNYMAVLDDEGNPQLVDKGFNKQIVEKDNKLQFMEQIDEWT